MDVGMGEEVGVGEGIVLAWGEGGGGYKRDASPAGRSFSLYSRFFTVCELCGIVVLLLLSTLPPRWVCVFSGEGGGDGGDHTRGGEDGE